MGLQKPLDPQTSKLLSLRNEDAHLIFALLYRPQGYHPLPDRPVYTIVTL